MDTPPPLPTTTAWPPVKGWPPFLSSIGAVIVSQVAGAVVMNTMIFQGTGGPSDWGSTWKLRAQFAIVPVARAAWQAWLVFRKHPIQFACWTMLPLISVFVPPTAKTAGYMGLLAPLIQTALYRGVRQRAWAWILAGMAG